MSFDFIDRKFGAKRAEIVDIASLDDGSPCPVVGCAGALFVPAAEDCSCHIRPPCSACASVALTCSACAWEAPRRA